VHAKDKVIPRGGDDMWESDALLHRVAKLTIGMAGADLANLLNEAAILMVSCNTTHWMPSALLPASWKSLGILYGQGTGPVLIWQYSGTSASAWCRKTG
jgi:hypothetical protein